MPTLVLIVDRSVTHRQVLSQALEAVGYQVEAYRDIAAAVASLHQRRPAVIAEERLGDGSPQDLLQALRLRLRPRPFLLVHGPDPSARSTPGNSIDLHLPTPLDSHLLTAILADVVPATGREAVQTVRRGDHIFVPYASQSELFDRLGGVFLEGMRLGERCVLAYPDRRFADEARGAFERAGIEVDRAEKSGALYLVSHEETYHAGGRFDPDRVINLWRDLVKSSLSDGYSGVRGAGCADWVADTPEDVAAFFAYEHAVADLLTDLPIIGLCLYPLDRFEPKLLLQALGAHPQVLVGPRVCSNLRYPESRFPSVARPEHVYNVRMKALRAEARA